MADDTSFSSRAVREFHSALTDGSIFGVPRYTTALLPSVTNNQGGLAWDTTSNTLKSCDGTAWSGVSGGGVTATHGGSFVVSVNEEEITLLPQLATLSTSSLIPANSIVEAVGYRVTQALTFSSDAPSAFQMGNDRSDVGTDLYCFAIDSDFSVHTGVGLKMFSIIGFGANPTFTSSHKISINYNDGDGTPANLTAGKIRVQVYYRQYVGPTS